ncbi:MAG TPA: hypothetical protein VGA37_01995 [Gemmatimonadales bacterium]
MRLTLLGSILLLGCGSAATGPDLRGQWGGEHVQLVVSPTGGVLEYDCASGTIDERIVPDASGRLDVRGTHTPGHGGPDVEGEVPEVFAARYTGTTDGSRMTVRVVLVDTGTEIGTFSLKRGEDARLLRCL